MDVWLTFWTVVLLGALVMFAGLTVVVTIGGFLDIRKMLGALKRQHRAAGESADES